MKSSCFFSSKVKRNFILKTQKKKKNKNGEEEDGEYLKEAIPGPGYYVKRGLSSNMKKFKKKFQFFSSSVPRFLP